jgi:hypothetical protein
MEEKYRGHSTLVVIAMVMHSLIYDAMKLDHIPSSCIEVMVHVVKGRQYYSAYTVPHMPAPQSQKWSLRPTLDLDSDKFRCRSELDSFRTSDQSIVARCYACYI